MELRRQPARAKGRLSSCFLFISSLKFFALSRACLFLIFWSLGAFLLLLLLLLLPLLLLLLFLPRHYRRARLGRFHSHGTSGLFFFFLVGADADVAHFFESAPLFCFFFALFCFALFMATFPCFFRQKT